MDISKRDAKVCVRVAGTGRGRAAETVTTWSSMTAQILGLREHLASEQVTCVVMEATSDDWKPFYYLLEDLPGVEVILVNALDSPAREEPAWPEDRRRARDLAGAAGRSRSGPWFVRAARAHPSTSRPDPDPHLDHP